MKKDVDIFLDEVSENFSELFVETFFIRYLSNFNRDDIISDINALKIKLYKKINTKLDQALKNLEIK